MCCTGLAANAVTALALAPSRMPAASTAATLSLSFRVAVPTTSVGMLLAALGAVAALLFVSPVASGPVAVATTCCCRDCCRRCNCWSSDPRSPYAGYLGTDRNQSPAPTVCGAGTVPALDRCALHCLVLPSQWLLVGRALAPLLFHSSGTGGGIPPVGFPAAVASRPRTLPLPLLWVCVGAVATVRAHSCKLYFHCACCMFHACYLFSRFSSGRRRCLGAIAFGLFFYPRAKGPMSIGLQHLLVLGRSYRVG